MLTNRYVSTKYKMSIYISSGAHSNLNINEIFKLYNSINCTNIELSGGKYQRNLQINLKKNIKQNKISFHNYFPPPKKSFVINLASDDPIIVNLSVKQIINSIDLCYEFGISHFSFHAGFLIDPKINQLGKIIKKRNVLNKSFYYRDDNLYDDKYINIITKLEL